LQVVVEELPSGDGLGSGGNDRRLSAGGNEVLQPDALGDGQPAALNQAERLVHLDALGPSLLLGDVADGEVVPLPLEPEGAVV
jgi:hypothetical protein